MELFKRSMDSVSKVLADAKVEKQAVDEAPLDLYGCYTLCKEVSVGYFQIAIGAANCEG